MDHISISIDNYRLKQAKAIASNCGSDPLNALGIMALCEEHIDRGANNFHPDFARCTFSAGSYCYHVHVSRRSKSEVKGYYECAASEESLRHIKPSPYNRLLFISYCPEEKTLTILGEITATQFINSSKRYSVDNPMRNDSGYVTMFGDTRAVRASDLYGYNGFDVA